MRIHETSTVADPLYLALDKGEEAMQSDQNETVPVFSAVMAKTCR